MNRIGTASSPYKLFARFGAEAKKRRGGFYAIGMKQAKEWLAEGRLFFDDWTEGNVRKAHCKICGKELLKTEGHDMMIYASNWYHLSFYFACVECIKQCLCNEVESNIEL